MCVQVCSFNLAVMPYGSTVALRGSRRVNSGPRRMVSKPYRRRPVFVQRPRISGFPDFMFAKLKYTQSYHSSSALQQNFVWRANSLYDPDVAIGGHQPMYFDQYMAVYGYGVCYGSKLTIKAIGGGTQPSRIAMIASATNSWSADSPTDIAEQPYSRMENIPTSGAIGPTMSLYAPTHKLFGLNKRQMENEKDFWFTAGADCAQQTFWTVTWQPADGATTVVNDVQATITYYVKFFRRNGVAQS